MLKEERVGEGGQRTWLNSALARKQRAKSECRERAGKINKPRWERALHCVKRNVDFHPEDIFKK